MARSAAQHKDDDTQEPSPESMVPALPEGFEFTISHNIPIPETASAPRTTQHPFALKYDALGHNDSFFAPLAYFLTRPNRTVENTTFAKMKDIINVTFTAWKNKGTEQEQEAKKNRWRLVLVARELGQDPEYPNMTGIRAWKVDKSR